MQDDQSPRLDWKDGVPVAVRFDDPYYSLEDGLSETRHVFLAGNDLPARFAPGFQIAELGFGTGLNLAALLVAWRDSGQDGAFGFTTFEAFPMAAEDMETALAAFPEAHAAMAPILAGLVSGATQIETPAVCFEIIEGDARETVARWRGKADAWCLDGFAPQRNPEMWEPGLLADVARATAAGGTAATYSAAGDVRRGLNAAGFTVERVPGYGRKRHMTVARLA